MPSRAERYILSARRFNEKPRGIFPLWRRGGISLEDLTGIRERSTVRRSQRSRHSKWAFAELRHFVEYKSRIGGIAVKLVDPRNTSRTCAECGHYERANRKSRDDFLCKSCGHAAPADTNAAVNISRAEFMQPIAASRSA